MDLFINYCYLLFIKLVFFVLTTVCVYIKRTSLDIFNKLYNIFSIFKKRMISEVDDIPEFLIFVIVMNNKAVNGNSELWELSTNI